jgi:glucose-6-phosphate dehydrogenase assembly protein OpcA
VANDTTTPATVAASLDAIRTELARTALSTSTMNFVVWLDQPERRDWVLERAALLAEKHPSFMLVLDRTGVRAGDATVHGAPETHVSVQGQRVDIDVAGAAPETIEAYVTALCPGGVPTVLWWSTRNLASRPAFDALVRHAATLVVDSSGSDPDDTAIRSLVAFHAAQPEVRVRDLAWLRLSPWQDMIANFFDDPNLLGELYSIRKLHIDTGSEAEALYLGGWLASRLGWQPSGRDTFADREGNIVRFERRREGEIRRVQSVCLDSQTSWYHGEVTEDAGVVRVWVEGEHAREPRLFPLQAIDNASLLERAVLETVPDDVFETALRSVGTLIG